MEQIVTDISQRLAHCSRDELRVISRVLDGIEIGRKIYGPMMLANDCRDFRREAAMEARDLLVYLAAHSVAEDHARGEFDKPRATFSVVDGSVHEVLR